jgi:hypothetical protein
MHAHFFYLLAYCNWLDAYWLILVSRRLHYCYCCHMMLYTADPYWRSLALLLLLPNDIIHVHFKVSVTD